MPPKTINTPEEQTLSDKRRGARTVRSAIQKELETLKMQYAAVRNGDFAIDALRRVETYIEQMIQRDKQRKGGLWN